MHKTVPKADELALLDLYDTSSQTEKVQVLLNLHDMTAQTECVLWEMALRHSDLSQSAITRYLESHRRPNIKRINEKQLFASSYANNSLQRPEPQRIGSIAGLRAFSLAIHAAGANPHAPRDPRIVTTSSEVILVPSDLERMFNRAITGTNPRNLVSDPRQIDALVCRSIWGLHVPDSAPIGLLMEGSPEVMIIGHSVGVPVPLSCSAQVLAWLMNTVRKKASLDENKMYYFCIEPPPDVEGETFVLVPLMWNVDVILNSEY